MRSFFGFCDAPGGLGVGASLAKMAARNRLRRFGISGVILWFRKKRNDDLNLTTI
jgi:hypothetical protein